MKYLPLIVLIVLVTGCAGSLTQISESEKTIKTSTAIPGQTQDQIFEATKIWMDKNLTSEKEAIEFENKEDGIIMANGQIDYPCSWVGCLTKSDWKVTFGMRVETADGIAKTTFRKILLTSPPPGPDPISTSGMNAPVWSERDMNAIRPLLLQLNNDLVSFLLSR